MRGATILFPLVLLAACAGGGNGTPQCGSTQGFVSGAVSGGVAPVKVVAMEDGALAAEATVESDGTYELNLDSTDEGLDFTLHAEDAGGCAAAEGVLTVKSCEEYERDFSVPDCQ